MTEDEDIIRHEQALEKVDANIAAETDPAVKKVWEDCREDISRRLIRLRDKHATVHTSYCALDLYHTGMCLPAQPGNTGMRMDTVTGEVSSA